MPEFLSFRYVHSMHTTLHAYNNHNCIIIKQLKRYIPESDVVVNVSIVDMIALDVRISKLDDVTVVHIL